MMMMAAATMATVTMDAAATAMTMADVTMAGGSTISFGQAGGRELPHPTHNTCSKDLKPSLTPAHMPLAVIPTSGLGGRASPKSAFESKAAAAVMLI